MAKKRSSKKCVSKKSKPLPTPQVLQRAAKAVITGKCPLSRPNLVKMKRHRVILRKLANMKGKLTSKKAFITRHKKQVGGFLPLLPLIAGAMGSLVPTMVRSFSG
jgi:hypothetical protein